MLLDSLVPLQTEAQWDLSHRSFVVDDVGRPPRTIKKKRQPIAVGVFVFQRRKSADLRLRPMSIMKPAACYMALTKTALTGSDGAEPSITTIWLAGELRLDSSLETSRIGPIAVPFASPIGLVSKLATGAESSCFASLLTLQLFVDLGCHLGQLPLVGTGRQSITKFAVDPIEHVDQALLREAETGIPIFRLSGRDIQGQALAGRIVIHELRDRPAFARQQASTDQLVTEIAQSRRMDWRAKPFR